MTPAQALSFEHIAYAPAGELLRGPWPAPSRVQPAANAPLAQPVREKTQARSAWLWVLLAIAVHAVIAWQFLTAEPRPVVKTAPQEIELLRQQVEPEPPKPLPPTPQPKPVQQQVAAPAPQQPQLRTAPAEAPVANAISIPENLSAAPTAAPVVAAPPAPPAPAPKAEEPITEANAYAGYLNNPPPVYPKAAQRQGLQGRVLLRVFVLASGQVGSAELKQSSGKPVLDEAALAAVRGWTFVPSKRGSTPIDGWTTVPIDFKLAS